MNVASHLVACIAATYLLWYLLGTVGMALSAPLFGVALAGPIVRSLADLCGLGKHIQYAQVEGRHFSYRGHALDVIEDEYYHRWIRIADVHKLIPTPARPQVLALQFPGRVNTSRGRQEPPRIRADALLAYLGKSTEDHSIRFRNWLEREVVRPSATIRQRLGCGDMPSWEHASTTP